MEKKATLLIKGIHLIYTLSKEMECKTIANGFIAIHHDEIIDVGVHCNASYVDKDTRILEGNNHIAIPAFIEVDAYLPKDTNPQMLAFDEFFMRYMYNGTLHIQTRQRVPTPLYHNYHYSLHTNSNMPQSKIAPLYVISQMKKNTFDKTKPFCISCRDTHISLQNQMLAAQMLAMKEGIVAEELLKALTCHPASYLGLHKLGTIAKGMQANILLLYAKDIHSFFYSLDQNKIAQIIHKGVRIYPNLLI